MSVRGLHRGAVAVGEATSSNAPVYIDSDDDLLKIIAAGSGSTERTIPSTSDAVAFVATAAEINAVADASTRVVNAAAATLSLTEATHGSKIVTASRAAGIAFTLPSAVAGLVGVRLKIVVAITFTGAASIKAANANDYMIGTAVLFADASDTVVGFATANTGTVATESDTIDLLGTANSTGGIKGASYDIECIATNIWAVRVVSDAGGTEATPFSATV